MPIGLKIRQMREEKGLTQGDIENVSGLLRGYISRVENGHTVPSIETLEKFAAALDVPLYRLFCPDGGGSTELSVATSGKLEELAQTMSPEGKEARYLLELKSYWERMTDLDREALLTLAEKLANH
jgi:transcriptional regulator with XRE-family HTH domain